MLETVDETYYVYSDEGGGLPYQHKHQRRPGKRDVCDSINAKAAYTPGCVAPASTEYHMVDIDYLDQVVEGREVYCFRKGDHPK